MKMSVNSRVVDKKLQDNNNLKKSPKDYENLTKEFFRVTKEKKCSENLCNYVWNVLIATSRGYGFNSSHCLAYSLIGLQELNLCYKYNPIYWYTANLIVDSGSVDEDGDNKTTDYGKIAEAIGDIQRIGVKIELPTINETDFGFKPNERSNKIVAGLKNLNGIGDEVARIIISHRPYISMEDFYTRMILPQNNNPALIKTAQMVKLIKAGCFTKLDNKNRVETMEHFLKNYVMTSVTKMTMSQYNKIIEYDKKYHIIPESINLAIRHKNFKEYVLDECFFQKNYIDSSKTKIPKCGYHDRFYILNDAAMGFFTTYYSEEPVVEIVGDNYVISEKKFKKENEVHIQKLKNWLENKETLILYNNCQFKELWNKHAKGSESTWEMDSLCAYVSTPHELAEIDIKKYGIKSFDELPEEPIPYDYYIRTITQMVNGVSEKVQKKFPKYTISRIAGTVLDADNTKHLVSVLSHDGKVVKIKMNKGQYLNYNRVISHIDENGKKITDDDSWFKRGNLVFVHGYRQESIFRSYNYNDSIYLHTVNLITNIKKDGSVEVQTERVRLN